MWPKRAARGFIERVFMLNFWSFDFTDPANQGWTGGTFSRVTTPKPFGNYSYRGVSTFATALSPSFGNIATSYIGCYVYWDSLATAGGAIQMVDGSTAQITITVETDGALKVRRGGVAGTVLASSAAGAFSVNTWTHLQLSVVYHGSAGSVELRKDGATVIDSASGVNTISTANLYANKVQLLGAPGAASAYYKTLYVSDVAFQGVCQTELLLPSANGTTNNFVPTGAASSYLTVDDPLENDGDTTYDASNTVGDIALYAMANMAATSGTVRGVKLNNVWKTDAGARSGARVVRSGGVNYVGADVSMSAGYVVTGEVLTQDPATTATWTIAGVNAIEFGAEVTA